MPSLADQPLAATEFFRLGREIELANPQLPRLGKAALPDREPWRFGQIPAMKFAAAELGGAAKTKAGKKFAPVKFLGLLGADGPLPLAYTEYAISRYRHNDDPTLVEFLNIFHQRAVTLFYRAWAASRAEISIDRADDDYFGEIVAALSGIYEKSLRGRDAIPDEAKRHFAGLSAGGTRSPLGLEKIICRYFGWRARVEEFCGDWYAIPDRYHCLLGGNHAALGQSAVAGSVSWEINLRFALRIGALALRDYEKLLPGGRSYERLRDWVNFYAGIELSCELRLELCRDEIPATKLGEYGQLGRTTWLRDPQSPPPENPVVKFRLSE
ncbi:MAG: type VI secretion system baseplate subunit TssG [Planctomycetota bacterium]|jgi:type VI secretion system protein ImpH|nr:type VI secretion system baseplate subunit TssG [Planctomycetota bacterium]